VLAAALGGVVAMLGEMLAFQLLCGDPLHGLKLSSPSTLEPGGALSNAGLTGSMVIWSLQQFVAGRSFGIALLITALGMACYYRRLSPPLRIIALGALLFWLVLSFGSYVPWEYRPFWRNARYLHPLAMPAALLFAVVMVEGRQKRLVRAGGVAAITACLLLLTLTGSWGQNVNVSRELLRYALQHPHRQFVTDVHTANEIYVLNGLRTPDNIGGTMDFGRSHYLDKTVALMPDIAIPDCAAVLINPLNVDRTPSFAALTVPHLGSVEHQTAAGYRKICEWIPPLREKSWSVRKPPARVHRVGSRAGSPRD
jgi:hypothetical protein